MKKQKTDSIKRFSEGRIYVISAPSGAGKTTLCRKLLTKYDNLRLSVSYTTRKPRVGEKNHKDYTFINKSTFMKMVHSGSFAEWAVVHGNMYGTSLRRLNRLTRDGFDVILDIDVHGARQIKKTCTDAVYIFILPPSITVLNERLVNRATDTQEVITRRLDNALSEIAYYKDYDYSIVNDDLDPAFYELESIIAAERLKTSYINKHWIRKEFRG